MVSKFWTILSTIDKRRSCERVSIFHIFDTNQLTASSGRYHLFLVFVRNSQKYYENGLQILWTQAVAMRAYIERLGNYSIGK